MTRLFWRRLFRALPALIWMGVIYRASATPGLKTVPLAQRFGILPAVLGPGATDLLEFLLRKSAHFLSFGILALLLYLALAELGDRRQRLLAAFALTVLYAWLDEWHQTFVPTRVGSVRDLLIDSAGGAVALGILSWWSQRRRRRTPPIPAP